jgi:hypothetical protein
MKTADAPTARTPTATAGSAIRLRASTTVRAPLVIAQPAPTGNKPVPSYKIVAGPIPRQGLGGPGSLSD